MGKGYRVQKHGDEIEELEVIKWMEKTVLYISTCVDSRDVVRENRISGWLRWFETREEAIEYLRERLTKLIESHRSQIEKAEARLAKLAESDGPKQDGRGEPLARKRIPHA